MSYPTIPGHIQTWKHNPVVNGLTAQTIIDLAPKTVFDFGAGDGFYGKLIKHLLPETHITGVEINQQYIDDWQLDTIYAQIICADIMLCMADIPPADLAIFGDVLEHIEYSEFMEVLTLASTKFKHIIINSPVGFQSQEHPVQSEIHRCGITRASFENFKVIGYEEFCGGAMFFCLISGTNQD